MKRFLSTLILLAFLPKTKAQVVFCPPGAEWHYGYFGPLPIIEVNYAFKYVRDSVIGVETVKVLKGSELYKTSSNYCGGLTLLKQKGDTVFFNNCKTQNAWEILYNFAAQKGQNWTSTVKDVGGSNNPPAITHTIIVDSIDYINLNNFNLKRLLVRYKWLSPSSGTLVTEQAQIIERMGCNPFLFNFDHTPVATDYFSLMETLCYQDATFGLKQFTSKACDYHANYLGFEDLKNECVRLSVFPNPVKDILTIEILQNIKNAGVFIIDIYGREVKSLKVNQDIKVDLSGLSGGIYFITVKSGGKLIYKSKLIKE